MSEESDTFLMCREVSEESDTSMKSQNNPELSSDTSYDLIFFSNTMVFFSKCLMFSTFSGPGHVPIARSPTPAAWHMIQH